MMKLVYVAGAYRSKWGWLGILVNIWRARRVAQKLWELGFYVICPHLNTALFKGRDVVGNHIGYLEGGLEMLQHCQTIYMLKGWEKSDGARAELRLARKLGLGVMYERET